MPLPLRNASEVTFGNIWLSRSVNPSLMVPPECIAGHNVHGVRSGSPAPETPCKRFAAFGFAYFRYSLLAPGFERRRTADGQWSCRSIVASQGPAPDSLQCR